MKIESPTEFVSFSDGVCSIYSTDEQGNKVIKHASLGFSNRILGFRRVFAARAVQVQANAVIRIPQVPGVSAHDTVEITGVGRYDVEMVQPIFETNPPSTDLTLRQLEMFTVTP